MSVDLQKNLESKLKSAKALDSFEQNCYGYSLKLLGLTTVDFWVSQPDMEEILKKYFTKCKREVDALVVFPDSKGLADHVGVVMSSEHLAHKVGAHFPRLESFSQLRRDPESAKYYKQKVFTPVLDKDFKKVINFAREEFNFRMRNYWKLVVCDYGFQGTWEFKVNQHLKEINEFLKAKNKGKLSEPSENRIIKFYQRMESAKKNLSPIEKTLIKR